MLSLFSRKKNILRTNLLDGMTDVHCHLLPGVDDGVQTKVEALEAILTLSEMGIRRFFLTPHVMEEIPRNNRQYLEEQFGMFKEKLPANIEMKLAAEYMLDIAFSTHLKEGLLTMGDKHVLVETSYLSPPPDMQGMLYELIVTGYIPVIAHPERYLYMKRATYSELKEKGCRLQLNLLSLSGFYGGPAYENSVYLLKNNFYDYVGSDFHNLNKHRRGLAGLSLDRRQQMAIRQLLNNNNSLYITQ